LLSEIVIAPPTAGRVNIFVVRLCVFDGQLSCFDRVISHDRVRRISP